MKSTSSSLLQDIEQLVCFVVVEVKVVSAQRVATLSTFTNKRRVVQGCSFLKREMPQARF